MNLLGSFETQKTFAGDINPAMGLEIGFGGVWVESLPERKAIELLPLLATVPR